MWTSACISNGGRTCGSEVSLTGSEGGFDDCELVELDPAICEVMESIVIGGALRDMYVAFAGSGGGVSPRLSVSFRIRIDPNSLGKSDVKVDCCDELGEYGR